MNAFNIDPLQPYASAQQQAEAPTQQQRQQHMLFQQMQSMPQPHAMPTPTAAPWNLDSMPWALASLTAVPPGQVMQFSGNSSAGSTISGSDPNLRRTQLHQKRKSELAVSIPAKQFISEEKITAHFNGLHISGDHATSSTDNELSMTCGSQQDYKVTAKELEEKLKHANRITICDQIMKLNEEQRKKTSFLPEGLMNRMVQPCTALVLWKPPPILDALLQQQGSEQQRTEAMDKPEDFYDTEVETYDGYCDTDTADADIDDFIDNNNTCSLDFNNLKPDGMDEDL